jgi:hypothetical protein
MTRRQPSPAYGQAPDVAPSVRQSAKCWRCGTMLRFGTSGMGQVIEICAHCDEGQPLKAKPMHVERDTASRDQVFHKVCVVCERDFTTPHPHRVQCGRGRCPVLFTARKNKEWKQRQAKDKLARRARLDGYRANVEGN